MSERLPRILRGVTITALVIVLVGALAPRPIGGWLGVALVQGTSMLPLYETGDLVVALGAGSYDVGDVVVYETGRGRVIHRIVGGDAGAGFVTQGDNRDVVDEWTPTASAVIGRPVLRVPGLGAAVGGLRDRLGPNGLVLAAAAALALAARPRQRSSSATRRWRPGSREAALAATAVAILSAGGLVLVARHDVDAWAVPIARDALARLAYIGMLVGGQAAVVAIVIGRSGHVRLLSWATDLTFGPRLVDVVGLSTMGRVVTDATSAREIRAAADRAGAPVLRVREDTGPPTYAVVTSDLVVRFTPAAPPARPFRRRTRPA